MHKVRAVAFFYFVFVTLYYHEFSKTTVNFIILYNQLNRLFKFWSILYLVQRLSSALEKKKCYSKFISNPNFICLVHCYKCINLSIDISDSSCLP